MPANPERANDNKAAYITYTNAIKAIEQNDAARLAAALPFRVMHNCDFGIWPRQKQLLHWTCQHNSPKCFDVLVSLGCDPAHRTKDGCTSLHTAAFYDRSDMVQKLLPHCNPWARNEHGETAMHAARAGEHKRGQPSNSIVLLTDMPRRSLSMQCGNRAIVNTHSAAPVCA